MCAGAQYVLLPIALGCVTWLEQGFALRILLFLSDSSAYAAKIAAVPDVVPRLVSIAQHVVEAIAQSAVVRPGRLPPYVAELLHYGAQLGPMLAPGEVASRQHPTVRDSALSMAPRMRTVALHVCARLAPHLLCPGSFFESVCAACELS